MIEAGVHRPDGLRAGDFRRLAQYVQATTGIRMPATKKTMLEGRLRRRVRALGLGSLADYCAYVFDEGGLDRESVHLIDAVTTNKTDFFREPEHFRFLAEVALPELAARDEFHQRPLVAWSAAASVGAEAYSIAMLLADFAADHRAFRYSVLATDICTEVLHIGSAGIYPEAMVEPVPMAMRRRYLRRAKDASRGTVRVAPDLRRTVQFARLNLVEGPYDLDLPVDVLFCRNILIYFDKPTQERVMADLCRHLVPGGYLFIGHSETIAGFSLPLKQVATTVYRRE